MKAVDALATARGLSHRLTKRRTLQARIKVLEADYNKTKGFERKRDKQVREAEAIAKAQDKEKKKRDEFVKAIYSSGQTGAKSTPSKQTPSTSKKIQGGKS